MIFTVYLEMGYKFLVSGTYRGFYFFSVSEMGYRNLQFSGFWYAISYFLSGTVCVICRLGLKHSLVIDPCTCTRLPPSHPVSAVCKSVQVTFK